MEVVQWALPGGRSPQRLPDLFGGGVQALDAAHARLGAREQVTRAPPGRVQLRHRLVVQDPDLAHQPGGSDQLPQRLPVHCLWAGAAATWAAYAPRASLARPAASASAANSASVSVNSTR